MQSACTSQASYIIQDSTYITYFTSSSSLYCVGRGVVTNNSVSLSFSSLSDPPIFTLVGDTSGGPPTAYTWTRNGQVITSNASYSISIQVKQNSVMFQESHYRSTLTVIGVLPGVYQYSVTNRATSGMVTDQFIIEGISIVLHNMLVHPIQVKI